MFLATQSNDNNINEAENVSSSKEEKLSSAFSQLCTVIQIMYHANWNSWYFSNSLFLLSFEFVDGAPVPKKYILKTQFCKK